MAWRTPQKQRAFNEEFPALSCGDALKHTRFYSEKQLLKLYLPRKWNLSIIVQTFQRCRKGKSWLNLLPGNGRMIPSFIIPCTKEGTWKQNENKKQANGNLLQQESLTAKINAVSKIITFEQVSLLVTWGCVELLQTTAATAEEIKREGFYSSQLCLPRG